MLAARRSAPPRNSGLDISDQKHRASTLSPDAQIELANECRRQAHDGYAAGFDLAAQTGKDSEFCHESGVFGSVRSVLGLNDPNLANASLVKSLQMETVPFNRIDPDLGKAAVAEYLVFKFLPEQADMHTIERAMAEFAVRFEGGDVEGDDGFFFNLASGNDYDWQPTLKQVLNAKASEPHE